MVPPYQGSNGPQNYLRALKINSTRARRARKYWGDSDTVANPINEIRKPGPLKNCEGPQKYDINGPNGPLQFLLILTPALYGPVAREMC